MLFFHWKIDLFSFPAQFAMLAMSQMFKRYLHSWIKDDKRSTKVICSRPALSYCREKAFQVVWGHIQWPNEHFFLFNIRYLVILLLFIFQLWSTLNISKEMKMHCTFNVQHSFISVSVCWYDATFTEELLCWICKIDKQRLILEFVVTDFRLGRFPPVVRTAVPVDGRFEHIVLSCNATSDHAIIWIEREAQRALDVSHN